MQGGCKEKTGEENVEGARGSEGVRERGSEGVNE